jgi:molecular chaperone DnaJ
MAKEDFYDTLGVARDADKATLKKAYRKLAMQYHPDRNPGNAEAEKKFKTLSTAYEVLKDGDKRAAYDRFGHDAFEAGGPGAGGHHPGGFASGFADIFDEMFGHGGGRGAQNPGKGSDQRLNMQISLEDAYTGKKVEFHIPTSVACGTCKGSGSTGKSGPATCSTCDGAGRVRAQSGFFTVERVCPTCQGAGHVIEDPCRTFGGQGRTRKEKTLSVDIPAGVEDGNRIRLTGEGEAGVRGAPAGDLYIVLGIKAHRLFERDGTSIYCQVPIPMTTAALGGSVDVPTVDGTLARVSVRAGTSTGDQFRLRGKGMSILRAKGRGDMFAQVSVETPQNLSRRQAELLREFEQEGDTAKNNPAAHKFFTKAKALWEELKN